MQQVDVGKLASIGAGLSLYATPLSTFNAFRAVTSIGGALTLDMSNQVRDFTGLEALTLVSGDMIVHGNAQLSSFVGLSRLHEIGGSLTITGNPMLPAATSAAFAARVTVHGKVTIN